MIKVAVLTVTMALGARVLANPYLVKNFTQDDLMLFAAFASKRENEDPIEKPIFEYVKTHKLETTFNQKKMHKFIPVDKLQKKVMLFIELLRR